MFSVFTVILIVRQPPPVPKLEISEEIVVTIAKTLQIEINRVLVTFQEIAVGNDTKRFVKVNSFPLSPLSLSLSHFLTFLFLITGWTFLYSLLERFLSLFCLEVG